MAKVFTQILTDETLLISPDMGFNAISIVLLSGVGNFIGGLVVGAMPSEQIDLVIGEPVTISVNEPNVIDDVRIDCSVGGTIKLIGRQ